MSLKVLLPVDRARNSKTAEDYALEFHKKAPLEVTLLSVINEAVLQDRFWVIPSSDMVDGFRARFSEILDNCPPPPA